MAALEARVREDLTTLPEESGSWEHHAEKSPLHHCGHLRSLRWVSVTVTGDLDEGRIGGFERQHAILYHIYGMLESATEGQLFGPTPKPDRTSAGCPPEVSAVIAWHREAAALETAKKQHRELAFARAVPAWRSTRRACDGTSHSSQATRTGEQRRKGQ